MYRSRHDTISGPILSWDIESNHILTDLCPLALNSTRGGFLSKPKLDYHTVVVDKSLREVLPPEVPVDGGSEELKRDLTK
jgi:hypothetical protein